MKEKAGLESKQESRLEALYESIRNAMEAFHLSKEEAMRGLKITQEDQAILMKMI